ncbi:hypothetical protein JZU46_00280 [bacterium]|nr:hypothetical protein [bacterium]
MKRITFIIFICLALMSCVANTSTIGNGKVDTIEKAEISLAVGIAFRVHPEAIIPAYGVSTALLAIMTDGVAPVTLDLVEKSVAKEVTKLKLDSLELQSFNDLLVIVKEQIKVTINTNNIVDVSAQLVVVKDIIQIVHDSAAARLNLKLEVIKTNEI